jgi:hypothetical protein
MTEREQELTMVEGVMGPLLLLLLLLPKQERRARRRAERENIFDVVLRKGKERQRKRPNE